MHAVAKLLAMRRAHARARLGAQIRMSHISQGSSETEFYTQTLADMKLNAAMIGQRLQYTNLFYEFVLYRLVLSLTT